MVRNGTVYLQDPATTVYSDALRIATLATIETHTLLHFLIAAHPNKAAFPQHYLNVHIMGNCHGGGNAAYPRFIRSY